MQHKKTHRDSQPLYRLSLFILTFLSPHYSTAMHEITIRNNADDQITVKYKDGTTAQSKKILISSDDSQVIHALSSMYQLASLTIKVPHALPSKINLLITKERETIILNNPQQNTLTITNSEWKIVKKLHLRQNYET